MQEKYTEQEVELIIKTMDGEIDLGEVLYLITDQSLRERSEMALQDENAFSPEEINALEDELKKYMISRFDKAALAKVISMDNGFTKNEIIEIAIHNPEFFEDGLASYEIQQLLASTMSKEIIQKALEDSSLGLDELDKMILGQVVQDLADKEFENSWNDINTQSPFDMDFDDNFSEDSLDMPPPPPFENMPPPPPPFPQPEPSTFTSKKNPSVLDYTQDELFAVKTYEGATPGSGPLSGNGSSYKTMNAMLFSGLDNEFARIYEDRQHLSASAIEEPEELLRLSTQLYSAMYKYGKKMERPARVKRVDRTASFPEIEERGEIISNFSTSQSSHFMTQFSKAHITLVDAEVQPGTACLDFQSFFQECGESYMFSNEREILVAPFSPVTMEEVPMDEYELGIRDQYGGPPDRKVKMVISAPEKAEPLTPEEEQDRVAQLEIFNSSEYRTRAANLMRELRNYNSKEEAMASIPPEEFQAYLKWKTAFQTVLKYQIRELSLEIDKGLEAEREAAISEATQDVVTGMETTTENPFEFPEEQDKESTVATTVSPDEKTQEDLWAEFDEMFKKDMAGDGTDKNHSYKKDEDAWKDVDKEIEESQPGVNNSEFKLNEDIWDELSASEEEQKQESYKNEKGINEAEHEKTQEEATKGSTTTIEWDLEDTLELPIITEEMLNEQTTSEPVASELPINEQIQEATSSPAAVQDQSLITQMDAVAAQKPLAKINAALKKFAEKLGLKTKAKNQTPQQQEIDDEEQTY